MNVKAKLKARLLEIPINNRAFREKHRLARDIDCDYKIVEFYLNELSENNILTKKPQYSCPNCGDTTTMPDELLNEIKNEEGCFECDNCMDFINPTKNVTSYVFYDIKDKEALIKW